MRNTCEIRIRALLSYFWITPKGNDLENISLIGIWNVRGVCYHTDCQWQVSCLALWEFEVPYSIPVIIKRKNFFSIFCSIYGIYISLESDVSESPSTVNMLMGAKHLWNLHESTFIKFFWSLWKEITSKISPLLKFEILEMFVKALTDDENYPFCDSGDLQFPSQMQISWK